MDESGGAAPGLSTGTKRAGSMPPARLSGQCLINVCLTKGNTNTDVLTVQLLSAIITDNATFHKRRDIAHAIKRSGHILEFLPSYSPDLNPIGHKWVQAKALRKRHGCSVDEFFLLVL
jgi:hypothetical protein